MMIPTWILKLIPFQISYNQADVNSFIVVLITSALLLIVAYLNKKESKYVEYFKSADYYIRLFMSVGGLLLWIMMLNALVDMLNMECTATYALINGEYVPFFQCGILTGLAMSIIWISWLILPNTCFTHTDSLPKTVYKFLLLKGVIGLTVVACMLYVFDFSYIITELDVIPTTAMTFCMNAMPIASKIIYIYIIFCAMIPAINELFIYNEIRKNNKDVDTNA